MKVEWAATSEYGCSLLLSATIMIMHHQGINHGWLIFSMFPSLLCFHFIIHRRLVLSMEYYIGLSPPPPFPAPEVWIHSDDDKNNGGIEEEQE